MNLLDDFQRAVSQLSDPRFMGIFLRSLAITIVLLVVTYFAFGFTLGWLIPDVIALPWIGEVTIISTALSFAAMAAMLVLSAFLMFPVAALVIGFFLEDIAAAVEEKHYPELAPVENIPFADALIDALKFMALLIFANIIAVIIYFVATVFAPLVFWLVNGFLLGREYFQLVAARRIGMNAAGKLRKRHIGKIWVAGTLMAVPLSIPILNLVVPFLGVAVFTHQFHRLNDQPL